MQLTMKSVKQSDGSLVFIVATDSNAFFKTLLKKLPKVIARLAKAKDEPDTENFGPVALPDIVTRKREPKNGAVKASKK